MLHYEIKSKEQKSKDVILSFASEKDLKMFLKISCKNIENYRNEVIKVTDNGKVTYKTIILGSRKGIKLINSIHR